MRPMFDSRFLLLEVSARTLVYFALHVRESCVDMRNSTQTAFTLSFLLIRLFDIFDFSRFLLECVYVRTCAYKITEL